MIAKCREFSVWYWQIHNHRTLDKAFYYFEYSAMSGAKAMRAFDLDILDERKTCRTVLDALDRLDIMDASEAIVTTIHAAKILAIRAT